jgi:DNA gyrase/topoisomerase IV subunit B
MTEYREPHQFDLVAQVTKSLVLYSLAEFQAGHATEIKVEAMGWAFSISDNGRGHSPSRLVAGSPYLQFVYSHLQYPFEERTAGPVQLQGIGMSLLNSLCQELHVSSRRSEGGVRLTFIEGRRSNQEALPPGPEESGNKVSGILRKVLQSEPTDEQTIEQWLSAVAGTHPGLVLRFNGHPVGQAS